MSHIKNDHSEVPPEACLKDNSELNGHLEKLSRQKKKRFYGLMHRLQNGLVILQSSLEFWRYEEHNLKYSQGKIR